MFSGKITKITFRLTLLALITVVLLDGCSARSRGIRRAQQKQEDAEKVVEDQRAEADAKHVDEVNRLAERQSTKTKTQTKKSKKKSDQFNDRNKKGCFFTRWFN